MGLTDGGGVLVDNTTVFGARSAWEAWPVSADAWFERPLAVDVRSLMDILESIILHERLVIDSSSRGLPAWPELNDLQDANGDPMLVETPYLSAAGRPVASLVVQSSIERLRDALADGSLAAYYDEHLRSPETTRRILPVFYLGVPREFAALTVKSFDGELSREAVADIEDMEHALSELAEDLAVLAMFVFRGFFYENLAHLYSMSYVPHTWRAAFLDDDKQLPDFGRYVLDTAGGIRQELSRQLNNEFGRAVFTEEFPVIASYVAAHTASRHELLRTAMQIRESESATRFRAWVAEIESSMRDQRELIGVDRARSELRATLDDLGRELGLKPDERERQKIRIKVGVPVASAETDISLPGPSWHARLLHRRTHLTFLRQIVIGSANIAPFATAYHRLAP